MTSNDFNIGDEIIITATFKNSNSTLVNPSTVVCKIRNPEGEITTIPNTNVSTGVYQATYDLTDKERGLYYVRWEATGSLIAATEQKFRVMFSSFY